jgi:hypothetical protein
MCNHGQVSTDDDLPAKAPDGQAARPRLLVWQDALNASPGHRAIALMDYVRRIGYVFQANVVQYNALVARMQDPTFALPILDVSNPQAHDDLLSEAERLLHNILMSLSTRIDQQQAFMRRHFSEDAILMGEYAAKIEADFGGYAPGLFLRDLRNYLTHHRLPVAQSRQSFSDQGLSVTFTLVRQPLQEWSGWTGDARTWLTGQGEQVEIVPVVNGYARIVDAFDIWLSERIGRKYLAEIRAYNREAEAFNREWARVFGM